MPSKNKKVKPSGKNRKHQAFLIVGIGASAGGLDALEKLFSSIPVDSNIGFVVIQHLSPGHKSIMADLLGKYTKMKVEEITDGVKVGPNIIYLNPPDKEVSIIKGRLHLVEPDLSHGIRLPINHFFNTLAEDQGEKGVCIILSGTGTDGTLGLKAVKDRGGISLVQEEKQAKYFGMPDSAIRTGLVDHILPVEKMASVLINFAGDSYFHGVEKSKLENKEFGESLLQKIFHIIRSKTGHDFSNYKPPTIHRRIERRMVLQQIKNLDVYLKFLKERPEEVESLSKDFLIGVTQFFRDPEAFELLQKKGIAEIVKNISPDRVIRVWVPGCATGEEPYSIAILFAESMKAADKNLSVQIFASDIDKEALEQARRGTYPKNIVSDVSPTRLKQFFTHDDSFYRIKKQIREMVVFAEQDITRDPPFSKLDLVSCRNMLIYMDIFLQKKIFQLFYITLNEGGFLFLGTSESIGKFSDLFSPVNSKWKLFKRKGSVLTKGVSSLQIPFVERSSFRPALREEKNFPAGVRDIAERLLLEEYGSPGVLINEKFDILYFYGRTSRYFSSPSGEPSFNILKMIREDLRSHLSLALNRVVEKKKNFSVKNLLVRENNTVHSINLVVKPVGALTDIRGLVMVIFEEKPSAERSTGQKKQGGGRETDTKVAALKRELQSTRDYLQTTIEELETSNEELKSTNEELQSTNEELQSTNEEMETSREELQSTNEELVTLNAELHARVEDLAEANNDLQNLLSSTEIGTVFLDAALSIRRFTPSATRVFNLIPSDVGRPFSDITSRIDPNRPISGEAAEVLKTLIPLAFEIKTREGEWFGVKILPYRTSENLIDGVVITCSEVSRLKESELAMNKAKTYAENIVEAFQQPFLVLDSDLRVISANKAFYKFFKVGPEETRSKLVYEIGNHQRDIPPLRKLLEKIIPKNRLIENFEVEHVFESIGHKKMLLNARRIDQGEGKPYLILIAFEDKT